MRKKISKRFFDSGLLWLWVAIVVVVLDRCTKLWIVTYLVPYESLATLPFFNLTLAHNTGAAFSFLHSASGWQNIFFISLAAVVGVMIIGWLRSLTKNDWWMCIALSLVLGGALGNVWDRIIYHYVIDFLDFHIDGWHFAIFNIADSAICIGAFMIIIGWWRLPQKS